MIKEGGSKLRCASCQEVFTVYPEHRESAPQVDDKPLRNEPTPSSEGTFDEDAVTTV
jgi:hypothetical protein